MHHLYPSIHKLSSLGIELYTHTDTHTQTQDTHTHTHTHTTHSQKATDWKGYSPDKAVVELDMQFFVFG